MQSRYSHLECLECGAEFSKSKVQNYCHDCHQPLVARYDYSDPPLREDLMGRLFNMWRYRECLPIENEDNIVSLGEGGTPILPLEKLGKSWGISDLQMKEETRNPTGSFKARGLGMAVSKAKELGIRSFCIPTAGNAGSALSAYAAKMNGEAHVFMPEKTPKVFQIDCEIMGASVTKVKGSIKDAGAQMAQENENGQWWDVTTLKEPFRLEGKKTMGFEIAEQYNWQLPDVIVYPTGGGTGLIGIWKAFQEMKEMGWVDFIPTRMVAIQSAECDPVVQAFEAGLDHAPLYENPGVTMANGLRVPKAFGDKLIMKTLKESKGTALAVSDEEMFEAMKTLAQQEGLFVSPEGAAVMHGIKKLRENGFINEADSVLALNTGSPYKYIENIPD